MYLYLQLHDFKTSVHWISSINLVNIGNTFSILEMSIQNSTLEPGTMPQKLLGWLLPFLLASRNDDPHTQNRNNLQTKTQIHASTRAKVHARPLRNPNYADEETWLSIDEEK